MFQRKSSRKYEARNGGVTLPDFKNFPEKFLEGTELYNFFYKTYVICTDIRLRMFLLEPPYLCFRRKGGFNETVKVKGN